MSGVIGVLAAMALLLWFSAYIEDRKLGPVNAPVGERSPMRLVEDTPAPAEAPAVLAVEAVTAA